MFQQQQQKQQRTTEHFSNIKFIYDVCDDDDDENWIYGWKTKKTKQKFWQIFFRKIFSFSFPKKANEFFCCCCYFQENEKIHFQLSLSKIVLTCVCVCLTNRMMLFSVLLIQKSTHYYQICHDVNWWFPVNH